VNPAVSTYTQVLHVLVTHTQVIYTASRYIVVYRVVHFKVLFECYDAYTSTLFLKRVHASNQALLLTFSLRDACTLSVAVVLTLYVPQHCCIYCTCVFAQQRVAVPAVSMRALVGRISQQGNSYLITGGTDRHIRYWDFQVTAITVTSHKSDAFLGNTYISKALLVLQREVLPFDYTFDL
jgi:hypothetical protein